MNRAIYIATGEPESGKSIITLGLMRILMARTKKIGYFRPIIEDGAGKKDNHIQTILNHFELDMEYSDCYALTGNEVIKMKTKGKDSDIIDLIIKKYKELEERFDVIVVEGTDFSGEAVFVEMDINAIIAKNLGVPVIVVASGQNKNNEELLSNLLLTYDSFADKEVEILGVVANKVDRDRMDDVERSLQNVVPESTFVGVIPMVQSLHNPTIKEISDALDAEVLIGEEHMLNQVESSAVGAMQLRNFLEHLKTNCLVITPGDRADVIMSSIQASISENYPKIGGIVLTGGLKPEPSIMKLIEGLKEVVPILAVSKGTFEVANRIGAIRSHIDPDNEQRIYTSLNTFDKYVNIDDLARKYLRIKPRGLTPRMFQYNLLKKAQSKRKHIVLPEGSDERILLAASRLMTLDVVDLTLLGDEQAIRNKMNELGVTRSLEKVAIVDPGKAENFDEYAHSLFELRKHKNVNESMAKDLMHDVSFYGTMMVHKGHADGMVSGAVNTTQHTIRPALQFVKTKPEVSVVSSVFFMCLEDRVSVFGDCAINPNPSAEQLAEIAISSADSSAAFGIFPKVAMLSYSSGASGKGADVDKVRKATEIINEKRPDILVEGPIQYDAAVDASVGKKKMPDSKVAGQASVLIFPDLNTGNNTYKAVQRETGATAIGPMLQGLNKPVNDLSRGCTVDDIFNTVIITAIQAQDNDE